MEEGDIEGALRRMPRFLVAEPLLLQVGGAGWRATSMPAVWAMARQSGRHSAYSTHRHCAWAPPPPFVPQALKQHGPSGYLNALSTLPRNLRTMYIHAYQSYLVGVKCGCGGGSGGTSLTALLQAVPALAAGMPRRLPP